MTNLLLVFFLLVTLALIGVILVQRSEGGGLGIGTSQGMGGFMTGRGTANLLTRTTAVLGTIFMALALVLAMLGKGQAPRGSILDMPAGSPPGAAAPATPVAPAVPTVPNN
jgi:preprotein translocase subunit SecG